MGAGSGYYLSAVALNAHPSKSTYVNAILVAAGGFLLMYYMTYSTFVFDDGSRLTDQVDFWKYVNYDISHQSYQARVHGSKVGGSNEVGSMAYVIVGVQFIAFLLSSLVMLLFASAIPFCSTCDRYFKRIAQNTRSFANGEQYQEFHDALFANPIFSERFFSLIENWTPSDGSNADGKVRAEFIDRCCPKCKTEQFELLVSVWNGKEQKKVDDLSGKQAVPAGAVISQYMKPVTGFWFGDTKIT